MLLQWHYIPNQALAFSTHGHQDSLSLVSVFQAHVPSNMPGSSLTPSSHPFQCLFTLLLLWIVCCRALVGIQCSSTLISALPTAIFHIQDCFPMPSSLFNGSYIYIYILYCWKCGIRAFTAAGLYNDLTFHVPKFMSNCLCKNDSMIFNKQFNSNVMCTVFTPIPEHSTLYQWNYCTGYVFTESTEILAQHKQMWQNHIF